MTSRAAIAAICSAHSANKQTALHAFLARRRADGVRHAGVVEARDPGAGAGGALFLIDLTAGGRIRISQNVGCDALAADLAETIAPDAEESESWRGDLCAQSRAA